MARAGPQKRGFTLLEVAISLLVMSILSVTIFLGTRALMADGRRGVAVKLINGLRGAARMLAKRQNAGLSFTGLNWTQESCLPPTSAPPTATLPGFKNDCNYRTPWGSLRMGVVGSNAAPGSCPGPVCECAEFRCFQTCMEMPDMTECIGTSELISSALAVQCSTVSGCGLGGSGPWLVVTGR